MRLNTLSPAEGAKHAPKRVGRGIGSGLGKTAGRGHKVRTHVLVVAYVVVLKVVRCLYIVVCRNSASPLTKP